MLQALAWLTILCLIGIYLFAGQVGSAVVVAAVGGGVWILGRVIR